MVLGEGIAACKRLEAALAVGGNGKCTFCFFLGCGIRLDGSWWIGHYCSRRLIGCKDSFGLLLFSGIPRHSMEDDSIAMREDKVSFVRFDLSVFKGNGGEVAHVISRVGPLLEATRLPEWARLEDLHLPPGLVRQASLSPHLHTPRCESRDIRSYNRNATAFEERQTPSPSWRPSSCLIR